MHHGHAVGRQVHVQLEAVGAGREPEVERRQRVFRTERASAAVREDQRMGVKRHAKRAVTD